MGGSGSKLKHVKNENPNAHWAIQGDLGAGTYGKVHLVSDASTVRSLKGARSTAPSLISPWPCCLLPCCGDLVSTWWLGPGVAVAAGGGDLWRCQAGAADFAFDSPSQPP